MNQNLTPELNSRLIQPETEADDITERLLADKINESSCSLLEESSEVKINKIKPVQKLILYNDNIRRMTTINGEQVPEPYLGILRFDIIKCFVFMYAYFNMIALFLCVMSVQFLNHALKPEQCKQNLHFWTYIMLSLVCLNTIFCGIMSAMLGYFGQRNRPELYVWRITLGRICMLTRTTTSKWIFYLVYIQDCIALFIGMVGWPLSKEAIDCDEGYEMFYIMTLIYQTIAIFRIAIVLLHFRYGQSLYRKIKRRFQSLNIVEYGRGVEFDVYYANDFLLLTRDIQVGDPRYSISIKNLNLTEMTCAICLENFILREGQDAESPNGKLVNLPCSLHHTFHPDCIKEWLTKSQECPLCKVDVFQNDFDQEEDDVLQTVESQDNEAL